MPLIRHSWLPLIPLLTGLAVSTASARGPLPDPTTESALRESAMRVAERHLAEVATTLARQRHLRSGRLRVAGYNPIDIVRTVVAVDADEVAGTVEATIDVTIEALENGLTKAVFVVTRLGDLLIEDLAGNPVVYGYRTTYGMGIATVELPRTLMAGEQLTLRFRQGGDPDCSSDYSSMLMCRVSEEIVYFIGPEWIPTKDANTYEALYTTGGVDLHIVTPPGYVAVSTSELVGVEDHGDHLIHHFDGAFSESLAGFAYAQYDTFTALSKGGKRATTYIYAGTRDHGQHWANVAADVLDLYSEVFRPYLYHKHDEIQTVEALGGGVGPQSASFYLASALNSPPDDTYAADLFSHEIAHSWWGGMVRLGDPISPWLNEGFAEYSSRLYGYRIREPYYTDYLFRMYFEVFRAIIPPESEAPLSSASIYDDYMTYYFTTYNKGAHVLRMLQWYLGDDAFFDGIQSYAAANIWQTTTTPVDVFLFKSAMEAATGLDLTTFFDQWIFSTGYPVYRWAAEYGRDEKRHTVRVRVEQVQEGEQTYDLPLEVAIWVGDLEEPRRFLLTFNGRIADEVFIVTGEPRAVKIDDPGWVFGAKDHELVADIDSSNDVDGVDLLFMGWARGSDFRENSEHYYMDADLTRDGEVNDDDLAILMETFGQEGVIP